MGKVEKKVVSLEDRIPKLQKQRKQKANRRLITFLSIFFLLILLVIYFQSSLSKVSKIEVKGNSSVLTDKIIELSHLSNTTGFWSINKKEVESSILTDPLIKKVTIEKQLPNYVFLTVEEYKSIAYVEKGESYFSVLENGFIFYEKEITHPADAPILINWKRENELKELVEELLKIPVSIRNSISEIHHTPTKTDRWHMTLYMNDGYEVSATVRSFAKKMAIYPSIVSELDPDIKGVIHLEVGSYFESHEKIEDKGEEKDEEKAQAER